MAPASPAAGPSGLDKVSKAVSANDDNGAPIGGIAQLSIGDEQPVEVKTTASGSYAMTASRGKGYSPGTERYSPPFVRNGPRSLNDDPFVSQSVLQSRSSEPSTPKSAIIMSKKNWRAGSNSSGDESTSNSVVSFGSQSTARKLTFSNEQAIARTPGSQPTTYVDVDPEDAQSVYPPEWCVFVANLLQSETDGNLTAAVHQVFSEYGKVYVKIRRDAKHMPFAFCQYTKLEHAQNALRYARGRLIRGRPCRCEMAKAERFYVIRRKNPPAITAEEARRVLEKYGKIRSCQSASPYERLALLVNDAVLVSFQMYDMGQAAMQALRHSDEYQMQNAEGHGSSLKSGLERNTVSSPFKAYLDRLEVDNRSIFVGNLPSTVTEQEIQELFGGYGMIENVSIRDSTSKYEGTERVYFAFVLFRSGITADHIVESLNSFFIGGNKLRVAHKVSDNKKSGSLVHGSSSANKSPTRRRFEQHATADSSPGYGSPSHGSIGYGSPGDGSTGHSSPGYAAQSYGAPVYGAQGYGAPYYSVPYNSPQGHYPQGYPPQYGYGGYGNFSYCAGPYGTTGQGIYPAPYPPPSTYPHQSAPSIDPQSPVASDTSGSPNSQPYWAPVPYYHPLQQWSPATTAPDASSPTPHCPVAHSTTTENNNEPEDQSATPTPSRPTPSAEQPVEVQQ